MVATLEHECLTKQSALTSTCAVGAGEGLFNRLVNSGEVGVGTTGFTSGGTSIVSSPVTCKNHIHNKGSFFYFTYYLSLPANTLPCTWVIGRVGYVKTINKLTGNDNQQLSDKIRTLCKYNVEL
jgi:hypothetical protein